MQQMFVNTNSDARCTCSMIDMNYQFSENINMDLKTDDLANTFIKLVNIWIVEICMKFHGKMEK